MSKGGVFMILSFSSTFNLILLILVSLAVFTFFYIVMGQMDQFLEKNKRLKDVNNEFDLIVFGELNQVDTLLNNEQMKKFKTHRIIIPEIDQALRFIVVAALSSNDLDNLILCMQAKRLNIACTTVALCNDENNTKLFLNPRVDLYWTSMPKTDDLLKLLKEKTDEIWKN